LRENPEWIPGLLLNFLTTTMFTPPVYQDLWRIDVQGKHEPAGICFAAGIERRALVMQAAEAAIVPMPSPAVWRDRFVTRWRAAIRTGLVVIGAWPRRMRMPP